LIFLAAGAVALRSPQLDRRPMHTDESVHALKFRDLLERGQYRYDPDEFHGPSLYYLTLPLVRLIAGNDFAATRETHYRAVALVFGIGLLLLLGLVRDGLGTTATGFAAWLTAISPAMVFYSRYYIHELILVFFTGLFVASVWRYSQAKHSRVGWCLLGGLSLGMMDATKETWILTLAALVGAFLLNGIWIRKVDRQPWPPQAALPWSHGILGLAAALGVAIVLFTSFFTNAAGPFDSLRTYLPWVQRAEGHTVHTHPWYYYLNLLAFFQRQDGPVFTEALILAFALLGMVASLAWPGRLAGHPAFIRFVGFYTLLLTAIYSAIPYKTPWCALNFLHGLILMAGVGLAFLWRLVFTPAGTPAKPESPLQPSVPAVLPSDRRPRLRRAASVLLPLAIGLGSLHLLYQAWLANYVWFADPKNPYVYAHTLPDITRLVSTVEQVAQAHPLKHELLIMVIVPGKDYWPLPWYLRQFKRVGWWTEVPESLDAPVIISSSNLDDQLDPRLHGTHVPAGYYAQRPGKRRGVFLELYVKLDVWAEYLKTLPPPNPDE
jgi:uncharacterized protein (TIGR03663 family)